MYAGLETNTSSFPLPMPLAYLIPIGFNDLIPPTSPSGWDACGCNAYTCIDRVWLEFD